MKRQQVPSVDQEESKCMRELARQTEKEKQEKDNEFKKLRDEKKAVMDAKIKGLTKKKNQKGIWRNTLTTSFLGC